MISDEIRNLLCESFGTSPTVKSEFESRTIVKEDQVKFLRSHAKKTGLWMDSLPLPCSEFKKAPMVYVTDGLL